MDLHGLELRERDARLRLAGATNGSSLCRPQSLSGIGPQSVKYLEGAAAALTEVRRAVRCNAHTVPSNCSVSAVVHSALERWVAQTLLPARSGAKWSEYLAGGIGALRDIHPPGRT